MFSNLHRYVKLLSLNSNQALLLIWLNLKNFGPVWVGVVWRKGGLCHGPVGRSGPQSKMVSNLEILLYWDKPLTPYVPHHSSSYSIMISPYMTMISARIMMCNLNVSLYYFVRKHDGCVSIHVIMKFTCILDLYYPDEIHCPSACIWMESIANHVDCGFMRNGWMSAFLITKELDTRWCSWNDWSSVRTHKVDAYLDHREKVTCCLALSHFVVETAAFSVRIMVQDGCMSVHFENRLAVRISWGGISSYKKSSYNHKACLRFIL